MRLAPFISAALSLVLAQAVQSLEPFNDLPQSESIRLFTIQGSNTIGANLAPNLAYAYLSTKGAENVLISNTDVLNEKLVTAVVPATNTEVEILIAAHGSGTGFTSLQQGAADIAAASRPVKEAEHSMLARLADMRAPGSEHILGIDGLAIIVNPTNPVKNLSVNQVRQIFTGEIANWSEVGGTNQPIHVYARDDKSGTWDSFKGMVLGKSNALIASATRYESNAELSDKVAGDSSGIGFVGLSSVRDAKLLSVADGEAKSLMPNKLTVATEDYALSRRLFFYTDDDSQNEYVDDFIQFTLNDQGQRIVGETGFVSQELTAVMPEYYSELPQDFKELTQNAQRLTINFRFQEGSAKLDNKALQDIERLVAYLQKNPSQEVVLIGFGDSARSEKRAQLLSKLRAMAIRRELVRNEVYPKIAVGYGNDLPVASSAGSNSVKNRRVEVWLRPATIATLR